MSITTSKMILTIILIIWLLTPLRSITIMIGGKKIFIKAAKGEKTCLYPIVNLFSMLEIAGVSTFLGILFFVPVANLFVLTLMSYKLGQVFKVGFFYKIGLIVFPIGFYPLLGTGKRIYKLKDDNYFKALDNARADNINLMTEEEESPVSNDSQPYEEEQVEVDSIFKGNVQVLEKNAPYKAAKIDLYGMEKLKNQEEEKKSVEEMARIQQETQKEKKEEVETLDL